MSLTPFHNASITVSTLGGRSVNTILGVNSLNTWTRRDGGFTVRVDNAHTIRFHKSLAPVVIARNG